MCSICAGTKKDQFGKNCICKDGTIYGELAGLRGYIYVLEASLPDLPPVRYILQHVVTAKGNGYTIFYQKDGIGEAIKFQYLYHAEVWAREHILDYWPGMIAQFLDK